MSTEEDQVEASARQGEVGLRGFALKGLALSAFVLLVIGPQAHRLAGPMVGPHAWRQCDTAFFALAFLQNGIDLLAPSVCWLGGYGTLLLEFPLPEALMALGYQVFGHHLSVARLLTTAFLAGSAAYLFLILRLRAPTRLAATATALYLILPLSLAYGRAVHIDFYAVFFAHGMTFHLLRSFRSTGVVHVAMAAAMGILGFLIKAPYVFYFALPLAFIGWREGSRRALASLGVVFALAAAIFALWRRHVDAVNRSAPDWDFLPGYFKMVDRGAWYFGPLDLRFEVAVWARLFDRFFAEVTSQPGFFLFLLGLGVSFVAARRGLGQELVPLWAWLAGAVGYVLIFFNLNLHHNYYQIPLLAPAAVFMALGLEWLCRTVSRRRPSSSSAALLVSLAAFLAVLWASNRVAETRYFAEDPIREAAASIVREVTPPDALVITAVDGPTGFDDPRLLFRARRRGWAVATQDVPALQLERFVAEGAGYLAFVVPETHSQAVARRLYDRYGPLPGRSFPIVAGRALVVVQLPAELRPLRRADG